MGFSVGKGVGVEVAAASVATAVDSGDSAGKVVFNPLGQSEQDARSIADITAAITFVILPLMGIL